MYLPMIILTLAAVILVFAAPVLVPVMVKIMNIPCNAELLARAVRILWALASFSALFYVLCAVILFIRRHVLVRGNENLSGPTWDCGYAKPSARMEYTGSAIVQCLADLFNGFLQIRRNIDLPRGLFPRKASFNWESPDCSERFFWAPLFLTTGKISDWVHKFQSGYLHMYILIMTAALIAMIIWAIVS